MRSRTIFILNGNETLELNLLASPRRIYSGNLEKELKEIRKGLAWMEKELKEMKRWIREVLRDPSSTFLSKSPRPLERKNGSRSANSSARSKFAL